MFVGRPSRDHRQKMSYSGRKHGAQTLLRNGEKGSPRSRAKAQIIREEVAVNPMVAAKTIIMMTADMPVPPPFDPVAWVKISMKG